MNAALYPANGRATEEQQAEENSAWKLNAVLDLLDDLSKNDSKWITVQLTHNNH